MANCELPNQRVLWESQHALRGRNGGIEATLLRDVPNDAAVMLASGLGECSNVLEAGSANGRDARFWASLGHRVDCIDFSREALDQLTRLAVEEGVSHLIQPHHHDIACGHLPDTLNGARYHAFYARSALHLADGPLYELAHTITGKMYHGGIVVIEGKGPGDHKIARSTSLGEGLVCDHDGHIRRVWTEEGMEHLARVNGWRVVRLDLICEKAPYGTNEMMRLIAKKGR